MNDLAAIKVIKLEPGECHVHKVSSINVFVAIDLSARWFFILHKTFLFLKYHCNFSFSCKLREAMGVQKIRNACDKIAELLQISLLQSRTVCNVCVSFRWWLCNHSTGDTNDEGLQASKYYCILRQLFKERQVVDMYGILWRRIIAGYIS